jgi:RNA polymerase sigma factor (sigma-70 family)
VKPLKKDADASLSPAMTAERMFLENLRTIERIASFVARLNHLNADESGEFVQEVSVRLLDHDYAIIRKFEGRASFSTYLTTVIRRLFQQWRTELWGKWRPSAEARRLGDKAITLERLITRDGYTFAEAVSSLTTPANSPYSVRELEAIYMRLPSRGSRPTLVSEDAIPEGMIAVEAEAGERVEMHDRERTARKAVKVIDRYIDTMKPEDRLILKLRFWQALKAPEIAQRIGIESKKVYKRLEKLFPAMQRALEEAGIRKSDIEDILCSGDQEIRFEFPHPDGENDPGGPSHDTGGKKRGGGEGGS